VNTSARRRCCVHRIPSRVRDDRDTPLLPGKDGGASRIDLGRLESGIFFEAGLDSFLVICPTGCFWRIARYIREQARGGMSPFVMAGLDPAIHVFRVASEQVVDARVKPGHDESCGKDAQD
jgi:hypothetical protein